MKKVIKFLENDLPLVISGAALSISVLLATINAITRYTTSYTINGADAFITLCFAYTVYVGSAAAYKRGQHYGVDILVANLPKEAQKWVQVLLDVCMAVIMILGFWLAYNLTAKVGTKTFEGLSSISYVWYDAAAVIGFGYSIIYSIEFLVKDIKNLKRKEAEA